MTLVGIDGFFSSNLRSSPSSVALLDLWTLKYPASLTVELEITTHTHKQQRLPGKMTTLEIFVSGPPSAVDDEQQEQQPSLTRTWAVAVTAPEWVSRNQEKQEQDEIQHRFETLWNEKELEWIENVRRVVVMVAENGGYWLEDRLSSANALIAAQAFENEVLQQHIGEFERAWNWNLNLTTDSVPDLGHNQQTEETAGIADEQIEGEEEDDDEESEFEEDVEEEVEEEAAGIADEEIEGEEFEEEVEHDVDDDEFEEDVEEEDEDEDLL
ncbi:hypothetical protein HK102_001988, partial [Quaeritorhiza haematococci]